MSEGNSDGSTRGTDRGLLRGVLGIVLVGVALGVAFNVLGQDRWGLPWIGEDKVAALESLDDLVPQAPVEQPSGGYNQINDPMAVGLAAGSTDLPEIPDLDRPIQIDLDAVKRLFDAQAALIVDSRETDEYAAGHIPGSLNMPYDEVSAAPERMEGLDAGGLPIVIYCGGGTCEVSLNLAWDLLAAGQKRVVVFMGGFPEWAEAGYPVETGPSFGV